MKWPFAFAQRATRSLGAGVRFAVLLGIMVVPGAIKLGAQDSKPKLTSTTGSKWKSLDELKNAAEKGDPAACAQLAPLYEDGDQVPKDLNRAIELYNQAAQGGQGDAAFRLGKIYHDGLGVSMDQTKAFGYFLQGAKAGISEAQYNVGAMLVSGRGVKRDFVEGLAWLIVATRSGTDPQGEKQVRERLARRPNDIAAAEKRAQDLEKEIANQKTKQAEMKPAASKTKE
ncbi:MAG TPA: tetratricopeptide repeat protein [Opitutaceae bacterium]|nr:tetratricopeptide repeat protein [Opitutaceae bacterium]